MQLKFCFENLVTQYSNDATLSETLWKEIEQQYTAKNRHYHNLSHLENIYCQLYDISGKISDWNCLLFSLFYHDIVYNILKNDNEEKSAALAQKRMSALNVPLHTIDKCMRQILATKKHEKINDSDTNYFIDADLSILGATWNAYRQYFENVRKEYSIYPDIIYNPGRKKVLGHFLDMASIYKTSFFSGKFEEQAKKNLQQELYLLQSS